MTKLKRIDIRSRKTMTAIIALCPQLKEIHFVGDFMRTETDKDLLREKELQSLLVSSASSWFNVISSIVTRFLFFYF